MTLLIIGFFEFMLYFLLILFMIGQIFRLIIKYGHNKKQAERLITSDNLLKNNTELPKPQLKTNNNWMFLFLSLFAVFGLVMYDNNEITNEKLKAEKMADSSRIASNALIKEIMADRKNNKIENDKIEKQWIAKNPKAHKLELKHPEWSRNECENIAKNMYWIGMSYEMLKAESGLPDSANPSNYGGITEWQWCWNDRRPSCFYDHDGDGKIDAYN